MANPIEIARWVTNAGWQPPGDAAIATAVAMRAGSDPDTQSGLFGLGTSGGGQAQANAAHQLWETRGRDWNVLPPYRAGGWQLYLPAAVAAVAASLADSGDDNDPLSTPVQDAAGEVSPINPLDTFGAIGEFLRSDKGWERIVKVGLGGALVLVSVIYLTKRTTTDQGKRLVTWIGQHADVIEWGRSAYHNRRVTPAQAAATNAANAKASAPRTVRKVVKAAPGSAPKKTAPSPKRAEPKPWSEHPTEERPRVRFVGRAKAPPSRLPGSSEKRVTAMGKQNARAKAGRGKVSDG